MAYYELEDGSGYYEFEDGSGLLELEDIGYIDAPFISPTTVVNTPLVENRSKARITQEPVEVLAIPVPRGRITQLPVEVITRPNPAGRLTQLPVEVFVSPRYPPVFKVVIID